MFENEEKLQRALLAAVDTGEYDAEASMAELMELTRSAGADPAFLLTQKRPAPDTATCLGSGMVQEAAELVEREQLDLAIFDRELSPTQIRNLEKQLGVRVVDRTMLILDIFAQRARSREGKLQVELAQLRYMLPRLSGQGTSLSRLGGGIGTRGPGETWKRTGGISAGGSTACGPSWPRPRPPGRSLTGVAGKTARSPWRWLAIPTPGKAP